MKRNRSIEVRRVIGLIAGATLLVSACIAQQTHSASKKLTPTEPKAVPAGSDPLKMDIRGFRLNMSTPDAVDHLKAITQQDVTRNMGMTGRGYWDNMQITNIGLPLPPIIDPNTGRNWLYEDGTPEQQNSIDFAYPTELGVRDDDGSGGVSMTIDYDYPVKDNKSGYVSSISYNMSLGPRSEEVRREVPAKLLAKYGTPQLVGYDLYNPGKPLDSYGQLLWCEHVVWVNSMLMPHYDCDEGEPILRYNWPSLTLSLDRGAIGKRNHERWEKDQAKPSVDF